MLVRAYLSIAQHSIYVPTNITTLLSNSRGRGGHGPLDFGRSVHIILTRGADYTHHNQHIDTYPTGISNLPTALHWHKVQSVSTRDRCCFHYFPLPGTSMEVLVPVLCSIHLCFLFINNLTWNFTQPKLIHQVCRNNKSIHTEWHGINLDFIKPNVHVAITKRRLSIVLKSRQHATTRGSCPKIYTVPCGMYINGLLFRQT